MGGCAAVYLITNLLLIYKCRVSRQLVYLQGGVRLLDFISFIFWGIRCDDLDGFLCIFLVFCLAGLVAVWELSCVC